MKKLIAGVLVLTILGSCGNKKPTSTPLHLSLKRWILSGTKPIRSIRRNCRKSPNRQKRTNLSTILSIILLPMMPCSVSVSSFRCPITREMRKPISKNATGSMMTYLPNSIIIRSCLIKKKTWIWWGHLTDLRSGGMDIRENPNGEKVLF